VPQGLKEARAAPGDLRCRAGSAESRPTHSALSHFVLQAVIRCEWVEADFRIAAGIQQLARSPPPCREGTNRVSKMMPMGGDGSTLRPTTAEFIPGGGGVGVRVVSIPEFRPGQEFIPGGVRGTGGTMLAANAGEFVPGGVGMVGGVPEFRPVCIYTHTHAYRRT
jgi:hypothetical protein